MSELYHQIIVIHQWVTLVVYPALDCLFAYWLLGAFVRHREIKGLLFMGVSSVLSACIAFSFLGLALQQASGAAVIQPSLVRILGWVQGLTGYVSMALFAVGIFKLVQYLNQKR